MKINPEVDFRRPKLLLGTFFGHVIKVEKGNEVNGSTPYNVTVVVAPESAELKGIDPETNEEVNADLMVGLTAKSRGIWFSPNATEKWKNKKYFDLYVITMNPEKDEDGSYEIGELDEVGILGKPVAFRIDLEYDKRDAHLPKEQQRAYPKVFDFYEWKNGKPIDPSTIEEYPF